MNFRDMNDPRPDRVYRDTMPERNAQIWEARKRGETHEAIGCCFNLTRERIRQIVWKENRRRRLSGLPHFAVRPGTSSAFDIKSLIPGDALDMARAEGEGMHDRAAV